MSTGNKKNWIAFILSQEQSSEAFSNIFRTLKLFGNNLFSGYRRIAYFFNSLLKNILRQNNDYIINAS